MSFLSRLLQTGIQPGEQAAEARRMHLTNLSTLLGCGTIASFAAGYLLLGLWDLAAVATACSLASAAAIPVQRRGLRHGAVALVLGPANLVVCYATLRLGSGLGFEYFFLLFTPVSFLIGGARWIRRVFAILPAILFVAVELLSTPTTLPVPAALLAAVRIVCGLSALAIVSLLVRLFQTDTVTAERKAAAEHERSERLLLNILPPPIANRLKSAEGSSIADGFAEATVLFADIVGFTELSQKLSPEDLVVMLNRVFTAFDALSDETGLEKIKTIGDCYMVAGGLTDGRTDHPERVVRMGVAMLAALDQINQDAGLSLQLRIGINTGPVVAGVIGKRKFIYDLWGDAVNTASRMESSGIAGRIQLTESTAKHVKDTFELEDRGTITVKGKGEMRTFLLVSDHRAEGGAALSMRWR